jgi:nanoRNase/pAp phosphatase (c-di-AMP/oligoRNAs hydrolase)
MDNSFKSLISQATSILVLLPNNPNFDQVAAGTALTLSLQQKPEVNCSLACATPMLVEFNRLVGVNKVTSDLGNKNLVISFRDYDAKNIERVKADADGNDFKLTVIPKEGISAPNQDQVIMSRAGTSASVVVLIDGTSEADYPLVTNPEFATAKIIHIGLSAPAFTTRTDVVSYGTTMSSVSEITTVLMKESALPINADIATNLLWGIENASKNYTGMGVTANTFLVVAELMRLGGKREIEVAQPTQPAVAVQPEPVKPPNDWLNPKIYTGTSVS